MSHFFAFLARMKFIRRWGIMRNTTTENIQEHTLQVSMIAHGLAVIRNTYYDGSLDPARVALLAMYHEVAEVFTGDLPTPVKYFNPQMRQVYRDIEHMAQHKIHGMLPEEMKAAYADLLLQPEADQEVWQVVKAADTISAYLKCVEEMKVGNQEFAQALRTIEGELAKNELPEVKFFMEKFVPSFSLSLDELNGG